MLEIHTMTKHMKEDRINRAVFIATTVGFGEVIAEKYVAKKQSISCLTDTGVIIVKNEENVIVTMYIATYQQAQAIAGKNFPLAVAKKVRSNEKRGLIKQQNEYKC